MTQIDQLIPTAQTLWDGVLRAAKDQGIDPATLNPSHGPIPPVQNTPQGQPWWPEPSKGYKRQSLTLILDPDIAKTAHLHPANLVGNVWREQMLCMCNAMLLLAQLMRDMLTEDEERQHTTKQAMVNEMHLFQMLTAMHPE